MKEYGKIVVKGYNLRDNNYKEDILLTVTSPVVHDTLKLYALKDGLIRVESGIDSHQEYNALRRFGEKAKDSKREYLSQKDILWDKDIYEQEINRIEDIEYNFEDSSLGEEYYMMSSYSMYYMTEEEALIYYKDVHFTFFNECKINISNISPAWEIYLSDNPNRTKESINWESFTIMYSRSIVVTDRGLFKFSSHDVDGLRRYATRRFINQESLIGKEHVLYENFDCDDGDFYITKYTKRYMRIILINDGFGKRIDFIKKDVKKFDKMIKNSLNNFDKYVKDDYVLSEREVF